MTWSLVQNPAAANGSGSSINKTFASNVTAGNMLVAFATTDPNTTCTFSSSGDVWTTTNSFFNTGAGQMLFIGVAFNVTGGSKTVTATFGSTGNFNGLIIAEFSGGTATSAVDVSTPGRHNASSTTPTDAAMVTTANGDLTLSLVLLDTSGATITAGGGATLTTVDTTDNMAGEFFEQASAGSIAMTFNLTSGAANATTSVAIKVSGTAAVSQGQQSTNRHPGRSPGKAMFYQSPRPTQTGNVVNIDGSLVVTANTTATVAVTHTVGGSLTVTANRSATVAVTHTVGGSLTVTANRTATVAVTHTIGGSRVTTVNRTATVAVTHTVGGSRPITVGLSATVAVVHAVSGSLTVTVNRTASIITGKDIQGSRPETVNRTATVAVTHTVGGSRPTTVGLSATIDVPSSNQSLFLPFF